MRTRGQERLPNQELVKLYEKGLLNERPDGFSSSRFLSLQHCLVDDDA